jgi:hypothetical protein
MKAGNGAKKRAAKDQRSNPQLGSNQALRYQPNNHASQYGE